MTVSLQHEEVGAQEDRHDLVADQLTLGAVAAVSALHAVTLLATFSRTAPYPPLAFVPFIAANLAVGVAAIPPLRTGSRGGHVLAVVFAASSLVSFGPHKLLTADMPAILPAVVVGFAFSVLAIVRSTAALRRRGGLR